MLGLLSKPRLLRGSCLQPAGEVVGSWGRRLPTVALWSPSAHLCKSTLAVKIQKVSTQKFQKVSKTNKIHSTPPQDYRSPTGHYPHPCWGSGGIFCGAMPLTVLKVTPINLLAHRIGFSKIVGALSDVNGCVYISPGSHIISYMYAHAHTHPHPFTHTPIAKFIHQPVQEKNNRKI